MAAGESTEQDLACLIVPSYLLGLGKLDECMLIRKRKNICCHDDGYSTAMIQFLAPVITHSEDTLQTARTNWCGCTV